MTERRRVLICGSRSFSDREMVEELVSSFEPDTVVISGGAYGADKLAEEAASRHDLYMAVYVADWQRWGRRAGILRNIKMLQDGQPTEAYAFIDKPLEESRGTHDMVKRLEAAGIPVTIITSDGEVKSRIYKLL
jgi:predicted TIM-barrel enzyme